MSREGGGEGALIDTHLPRDLQGLKKEGQWGWLGGGGDRCSNIFDFVSSCVKGDGFENWHSQ